MARRRLELAVLAALPLWLAAAEHGIVRGTVVDRQGRAVEGATVVVETDPSELSDRLVARTDPAGAFAVRGVPGRRVLLRVSHPSYAPAVVPEVHVVPGRIGPPVRVALSPGARVEGRVRHRDGRAFTAGRVIVQGSSPAALHDWPRPFVPDETGAFAVDHVAAGPARVHVLAFTPGRAPPGTAPATTLSPIGGAALDLRDGDVTTVEIALHDVVVAGRVTRGGLGKGGVRVTLSGPARSITFPDMAPGPSDGGPPMLSAITREDGTYEVVAFEPGPLRVDLADVASGEVLASRPVVVADADRFALDLEVTEARVDGTVVAAEDGLPLAGVEVRLLPSDPDDPARPRARSDARGRFAIGAEAGEHVLTAETPGRVRIERPVSVSADGLSDLRLEMERGLAITGVLLDEAGRPASAHAVFAAGADGFERGTTREDGSFRIEGLTDRPYALSAGSRLAGFATRRGVVPGGEPVRMSLGRGGEVALRVVSGSDRPIAEAEVAVLTVDGERVDPFLCVAAPTDRDGATTLGVPAGQVGLAIRAGSGVTLRTAAVASGARIALEVRLEGAPTRDGPD